MQNNRAIKIILTHIRTFISFSIYNKIYICSKYGFGTIILEGIIDYALNVILLVQYNSRRVVIVSSWGDV